MRVHCPYVVVLISAPVTSTTKPAGAGPISARATPLPNVLCSSVRQAPAYGGGDVTRSGGWLVHSYAPIRGGQCMGPAPTAIICPTMHVAGRKKSAVYMHP
jgi:hypothetical protein